MRKEAARLANIPGFETTSDEKLASRIVGRWMSGAPVNRVPDADNPALGADKNANNPARPTPIRPQPQIQRARGARGRPTSEK